MYATDFEYDDRLLSDYGFIICSFDGTSGANTIDIGQKLTFNKASTNKGKYHSLTGVQYDDCLELSFEIAKNPDIYENMTISAEEYRDITRWLNRPTFNKFRLYSFENEMEPCYFEASFNVSKITVGEVLCGLSLDMITNRPFGFGRERVERFDFSDATKECKLTDCSDEIGYIYPTSLKIVCEKDGDIIISNALTDSRTAIKNCVSGEEVIIDGRSLSISTSVPTHDIYNDFNYDYFKIGNTFKTRVNKITASSPCQIEIKYSPIIKNIPS